MFYRSFFGCLLSSEIEKKNLLKEENSKLETKISEMLIMLKEATSKATAEQEAKAIKIQTLLGDYKNLEANLSSTIEKENLLNEENVKLEAKITEMMGQIKEATSKATQKESKKIEQLTTEYKSLEAKLSREIEKANLLKEEKVKLEAQNSELMALKKEATAKAITDKEAADKVIEQLSVMQRNLEGNLSSEVAKGTLLTQKNQALETKLADMLKAIKESMEKAKIKEEAEAKNRAQLEQLIQEKAKAEKLAEQNALQLKKEQSATATALLAVEEAKSKLDTLTKERAEMEKLAKEKAEAQRIAQEKAENERIAQEEAKAKKEAEEKTASKKVAKEKLLNAFTLTQVEFKINSMELTSDSKKLLDATAKVMKDYIEFHYKIQGHTDSRGKEEFNIKLSANRAEQVKQYLVSQGVQEELLSTEGVGSAQPIADNETTEGRFKNRRVVFEIVE